MKMADTPKRFSMFALYTAILLALFAPRTMNPEWNFDSVAYVAAAKKGDFESREEWHAAAYTSVAQAAPKAALRKITRGSQYRKQLHQNPEYFETQLPFYRSKIVYVILIRVMDAIGVNPATASHLVSTASIVSLGLLAVLWAGVGGLNVWVFGAALCLMLSSPFRLAVGFSNPDPLCAAFLCWGIYSIRHGRKPLWGIALMTLAVLTRADAWIMVSLLLFWLYWSNPEILSRKAAVGGWLVSLVAVGSVMVATKPYSWGVVAQHTFVKKLFKPDEMDQTIAFNEYLNALWRGAMGAYHLYPTALGSFLLLSAVALGWVTIRKRDAHREPAIQLIGLAWLCAVLHFLLFPSLNDRFYLATYFIVSCESIALIWVPAATVKTSHVS
jgi:hypothetical protein